MTRARRHLPTIAGCFWDWVDKSAGPEACWIWLGKTNHEGYGALNRRIEGEWFVHRVTFRKMVGAIPEGLILRHTCDNRICCNPAHLLTGTQAENARDAMERGRLSRGESHYRAKVTDAQVIEIREAAQNGETYTAIGARFGISRTQASNIANMRQRRAA